MNHETEVLWLDEHRVVSLHELVEIQAWEKPNCSSSCTAARFRRANRAAATASARAWSRWRAPPAACATISSWTRAELGVALRLLERVRDLEEEIARLRARDCPRSI